MCTLDHAEAPQPKHSAREPLELQQSSLLLFASWIARCLTLCSQTLQQTHSAGEPLSCSSQVFAFAGWIVRCLTSLQSMSVPLSSNQGLAARPYCTEQGCCSCGGASTLAARRQEMASFLTSSMVGSRCILYLARGCHRSYCACRFLPAAHNNQSCKARHQ